VTSGNTVNYLPKGGEDFTLDGQTIYGFSWNTASDGSGTTFDDTTTVSSETTVYAQYNTTPPAPGVRVWTGSQWKLVAEPN